MKLNFFKYLFIFSITALFIYSCVKKTSYPTVPEIEYQAFFPFVGDSADLQIKFKDGDGDIGTTTNDTTRTFWYTYYYQDTVTQLYRAYYSTDKNDTLRTSYVITAPPDSYNGKPISGEISIRLQRYRHSKKYKHIKYVIYIYDKAGNKSNIVTTPELIAP